MKNIDNNGKLIPLTLNEMKNINGGEPGWYYLGYIARKTVDAISSAISSVSETLGNGISSSSSSSGGVVGVM